MNYYIKRDLQEYGPYTLADLQKYVKSGQISMNDMCRSEGMEGLLPVSQIVGNIPAPQPVAAGAPAYGGTVYSGAATGINISSLPKPPNLHWGVVLLLAFVTCGLFMYVWLLVEAVFVKKVDPKSKAVIWLIASLACYWALPVIVAAMGGRGQNESLQMLTVVGQLAGLVFHLIAIFGMKASLEEYYNSQEPIGLQLSGVMVFFFAVFYFQYHFTEINERHKMMGVAA